MKANNFCDRRELAKEVVELLMTAADGAKFLIDASDQLIFYVEIAHLFGTLGYQWKAAFFSGQVAQLYLQQEDCLSAKSLTNKEMGSSSADIGKVHLNLVVALFESQWSTQQMVVLRVILMSYVRGGDPLVAWSVAAVYCNLITLSSPLLDKMALQVHFQIQHRGFHQEHAVSILFYPS
ncbi:hypothetical protein GIB67_012113 [Kingdonia uniflora]|uniref:Uncharacterized protein n=1 Tax=Kingdonia uniflora TaxID=39325 RepID=A0A7J7LIC8_9MAGN|nr:hypothetical protein GIB67_012113 [Kingdonia uniflora]